MLAGMFLFRFLIFLLEINALHSANNSFEMNQVLFSRKKQEDQDGPISVTRANIFVYLILAFPKSRLL